MIRVEYSANNSGGHWWIDDEHWLALEEAGWTVEWYRLPEYSRWSDGNGRFMGALATRAYRDGLTESQAIEEFTRVTGLWVDDDQGCPTCGSPHYFYERHIDD